MPDLLWPLRGTHMARQRSTIVRLRFGDDMGDQPSEDDHLMESFLNPSSKTANFSSPALPGKLGTPRPRLSPEALAEGGGLVLVAGTFGPALKP
jgi:hypothetical protein